MLKKSLAILALSSLAVGAFAQELDRKTDGDNFHSTRTRAEVQAEVAQAHAHGELPPVGDLGFSLAHDIAQAKTVKTTTQVKAELAAYQKSEQAAQDRALYTGN